MRKVFFVLPSLRISGGVKQVLKLGCDLAHFGRNVTVITMWQSKYATDTERLPLVPLSNWQTRISKAAFQMPFIAIQFIKLVSKLRLNRTSMAKESWIFTHYVTLPLSIFVKRDQRWFFVQDLEWNFISNRILSAVLRSFILFFYRRGNVLSANEYLSRKLQLHGISVSITSPIWADQKFFTQFAKQRNNDIVMVLRNGVHKRLDLYIDFIKNVRALGFQWTFAVITPETDIAEYVKPIVSTCIVRPSVEDMRSLYSRSTIFLMLSDHEGFGLPPLEAMGSGCIPICRDAGGTDLYMKGSLQDLLIPTNEKTSHIIQRISQLINDPKSLNYYSMEARKVFCDGLAEFTASASLLADHI